MEWQIKTKVSRHSQTKSLKTADLREQIWDHGRCDSMVRGEVRLSLEGFSCLFLRRPSSDTSLSEPLHYLWAPAHLEIKHLLICQKHKHEVLPISLTYKFGRRKEKKKNTFRTFNWWERRLVTWAPRCAAPSHPPLLLWRRTERKGRWRGGEVCVRRDGVGRRQHSRSPFARLREDGFREEAPLHLFVLTCLYGLFHLKVATTDLETEMDRKTGRGTEGRAICQHGATTLTAAVCANISVGRQGKITILRYGRWKLNMCFAPLKIEVRFLLRRERICLWKKSICWLTENEYIEYFD